MSAGGHWRRSQAVPNVRRRTLGTAWESTYGSGGSPGSFREMKPRFALTRPDPSSGGVGGLFAHSAGPGSRCGVWKPLWSLFGAFWKPLGALFGSLRGLLGPHGGLLGRLGASGAP